MRGDVCGVPPGWSPCGRAHALSVTRARLAVGQGSCRHGPPLRKWQPCRRAAALGMEGSSLRTAGVSGGSHAEVPHFHPGAHEFVQLLPRRCQQGPRRHRCAAGPSAFTVLATTMHATGVALPSIEDVSRCSIRHAIPPGRSTWVWACGCAVSFAESLRHIYMKVKRQGRQEKASQWQFTRRWYAELEREHYQCLELEGSAPTVKSPTGCRTGTAHLQPPTTAASSWPYQGAGQPAPRNYCIYITAQQACLHQ